MEVIIRPDAAAVCELAARVISEQVKVKPGSVLGLATGRTMEALYKRLSRMHREEGLDFSRCSTFNLDEYVGVPAADEHSYRFYMNQHFFSLVNIDLKKTHLPNGTAGDLKEECRHYEQLIVKCGGIDFQLLGIGEDGHIGFNEPLSSLKSRTRDKALTPDTIRQNCEMFGGDESRVPRRALTMGVGTILDARRILLVATGKSKAAVLHKAVEGPITSMISASALQLHPACTIICDEDAASKLEGQEYYHWIFENEPEWQSFR